MKTKNNIDHNSKKKKEKNQRVYENKFITVWRTKNTNETYGSGNMPTMPEITERWPKEKEKAQARKVLKR